MGDPRFSGHTPCPSCSNRDLALQPDLSLSTIALSLMMLNSLHAQYLNYLSTFCLAEITILTPFPSAEPIPGTAGCDWRKIQKKDGGASPFNFMAIALKCAFSVPLLSCYVCRKDFILTQRQLCCAFPSP